MRIADRPLHVPSIPATIVFGAACLLLNAGAVWSNQPGDQAAPAPLMVVDVYLLGHENAGAAERNRAAIDDIVVVNVSGLRALVNQSQCINGSSQKIPSCIERPVALFLDDREIRGVSPEAVDVNTGHLQFHLRRNAENNEVWADLLGAPPLGPDFFTRAVKVSVGLRDGSPEQTTVRNFMLVRIDRAWFIVSLIGMILMIAALVRLALKSDILRSGTPAHDANGTPLPRPFSLARFQMAFWFVLVIASYFFIWLITNASDTISGSVLALIGIGAGTALGAAVIDAGKNGSASISRGFLKDILADDSGLSFHRFQMFVWTIVLGIMFISSVYDDLSMPEFSATLLGLQGISAGTYLGFKIPEKDSRV